MRSNNTTFNLSFHGIRGLAAFIIFFTHTMNGYIEHLFPEYESEIQHLMSNIGTFGVEIFFFLSGFVIYLSAKRTSMKDFFSHRFWRIYPVFILFTVIYFIFNHYMQIVPEKDNVVYFVLNMFFLTIFFDAPPLTPNAWTVVLEVWYYVATYFIVYSLIEKKNYILTIIGIFLAIYLIIFWPITLFYLTGVMASIFISHYQIYISKIRVYTVNTIQIFVLVTILFLAAKGHEYYEWSHIVTNLDTSLLLLSLFIFMILMFNEKSFLAWFLSRKIFLILGTVSYTLYLAHPYSYILTRKITEYFFIENYSFGMSTIIFSCLILFFTLLSVWLVHFFIEAKIYKQMTGKKLLVPVEKSKDV